jgi:hypothetical protein
MPGTETGLDHGSMVLAAVGAQTPTSGRLGYADSRQPRRPLLRPAQSTDPAG